MPTYLRSLLSMIYSTHFATELSAVIMFHSDVIILFCYFRTFLVANKYFNGYLLKIIIKGHLQRFHKLIPYDRIWPSEHGFEVIFEKSLFVFEISGFTVRKKRRIHSRFHSFSENNNRETFICDVTSDQNSMIGTEDSELRDCKASGNC